MKPFKHVLLQLLVLTKYIFVFVKKTHAVRAVQGNIESILDTIGSGDVWGRCGVEITIQDVTTRGLRGGEE